VFYAKFHPPMMWHFNV